ncbi:hypothetical protein WN944_007609 [Citrus x changshan-huyou]|uniref:TCTP domain-containing protein n=1 Tax=Citrus x changshan-huyou TaxID=2935761 RepID=A0AAP0MNN4_9ROSI
MLSQLWRGPLELALTGRPWFVWFTPLIFSAHFSLSYRNPTNFTPTFLLHFKPQFGNFSLHKTTSSSNPSPANYGPHLQSGPPSNIKFANRSISDESFGWQDLKLEPRSGNGNGSFFNVVVSIRSDGIGFVRDRTSLLKDDDKKRWDCCKSKNIVVGDELLSDSFPYKEIENGMLWEVEGKWVVQGAVNVDIGANPSAEGGDDDEGVDDQAVKVVDIVDTFRLQEQPAFDKKQFVTFMKRYIKLLTPKLEAEKQELFKKNIEGATKFLLSKLSDLQFFVGESMQDDAGLVLAYYKEGATDPTFLYFAYGLKEVKC